MRLSTILSINTVIVLGFLACLQRCETGGGSGQLGKDIDKSACTARGGIYDPDSGRCLR